MKALVLIAHGSKKDKSNQEFKDLVSIVRQNNSDKYENILASFLEFERPFLEDIVKELALKDTNSITIYPFFLNSGKHVVFDIPNIVKNLKIQYPNIEFNLLPHFGASSKIISIISQDI